MKASKKDLSHMLGRSFKLNSFLKKGKLWKPEPLARLKLYSRYDMVDGASTFFVFLLYNNIGLILAYLPLTGDLGQAVLAQGRDYLPGLLHRKVWVHG